ncbi:MAG: glycosyltransferase family 1 protein, partial [Alteraurantiacibacter sp. bin_em_oilr2.035]|nr:glycosyltransferase family 1 protein [Alteraurantiacibacter sp. bin_em_oilr2.035]
QSFDLWGKFLSVQMPEPHQLAHWTYPLPMKAKGCPNVYTLHDLVPLRLPYTTLDKKRRYLNLLRRIAKTADHIVTVSEHSRRDIIELLGVPEAKVTNTYQSVHIPDEILKIDEAQVTRDVEGVAGVGCQEYLLYWGAIEPKKNVGRLIEAYLSSNIKNPLVIVGARAWKSDQELRLLNSVNSAFSGARSPGNRIVLLDYVPFRLLMSLIRGAKGAIFPSLYEGFGLPVLEAMLLGTPVICSDTSSLPEVAGDAALTVDPYNTDQLSSQITRLDSDADLRADLSRRGIARAARFSPDLFRQRMHEVYKTLV